MQLICVPCLLRIGSWNFTQSKVNFETNPNTNQNGKFVTISGSINNRQKKRKHKVNSNKT